MPTLLEEIPVVDELLASHSASLGNDFPAYRNHVYRVVNLCLSFLEDDKQLDKIAIAATFHDIGIWTDHTFDYLPPSCRVAHEHLDAIGRSDWVVEIRTMILEHHKILRYRGDHESLVEGLRRADWVDVTKGLLSFGLRHDRIREVLAKWPSAGFHRRLVALELMRLRTHPLNPLPMLRL